MTDKKRLIEVAFPLEQTSLDSVHEKNVRHGHISTLHIWPARRPLAACRAALIATLLPDPGDKAKRDEILMRLGGTVIKTLKKKTMPTGKVEEIESKETVGGILHWGRESEPDLEWFRQEIRKAYGGRAPKVLDPFAGGGAIPLEAMRLGCEVTAVDINPVAWFILKCTLEYPQKLAGHTRKLPGFVLQEPAFMESYIKNQLPDYLRAKGVKESDIKKTVAKFARASLDPAQAEFLASITSDAAFLEADLAWHVRAWGHWVLRQARKELAPYYPTYAEFCSVKPYARVPLARSDEEQLKLVPTNQDGESQVELLNAGFDKAYLDNDKNPRWIAKPTVAYLWARTVKCKACRATIPLLKTRWLAKKEDKRVLLTVEPNAEKTGVIFGTDSDVKIQGGNPAQRREHDRRIGAGTMTRSGAACPCCKDAIMTMDDIRVEGQSGRLGFQLIAVAQEGALGKEYRAPTSLELGPLENVKTESEAALRRLDRLSIDEAMDPASTRSISCQLYGVRQFRDLFSDRQALALAKIGQAIREASQALKHSNYRDDVSEGVCAYLALSFDRLLSFTCVNVRWKVDAEAVVDAFSRFSISLLWDFAEPNAIGASAGAWIVCNERIATALDTYFGFEKLALRPNVICEDAAYLKLEEEFDLIMTDPPYYQAISYADLSDFFYTWLRGVLIEHEAEFEERRTPKLGEIVQHIRSDKNRNEEKLKYEHLMSLAFSSAHSRLKQDGRFVCVFAHKDPDAWGTLVNAIIQAGFVVDASWPIQTEMTSRQRATANAALSSSVWLVCKKRDPQKRAGWDTEVIREIEASIRQRLRGFWDAGIKGPDFVWAATGPALEAYSQYPAVKKATEPGALMSVGEFLRHVRRIVVDFVVGRVLSGGQEASGVQDVSLDDITTYYLLHRNDFGLKDAPAGACILYAVSCGLSERLLADQHEILSRGKGAAADDDDDHDDGDDDEDLDQTVGSGGTFKLKGWNQRKHRGLGIEPANGRLVPLIDQAHKLMHLWKAGDENKVNDYLDQQGLRRSAMFAQLLQALIEKSRAEGQAEECSLLEKLSNHLRKIGATAQGALAIGG